MNAPPPEVDDRDQLKLARGPGQLAVPDAT